MDLCEGVTCEVPCVKMVGVACVERSQCHRPGTCDSATGLCAEPSLDSLVSPELWLADETPCDDGYSDEGRCLSGVCVGPTSAPTPVPTRSPTVSPTPSPSPSPTAAPTASPTTPVPTPSPTTVPALPPPFRPQAR